MRKMLKGLVIGVMAIGLFSGCNRVTVEPAQLGKVLSPSGYSNEILTTGKHTLGLRDELVVLDVSTNTYRESMTVILSDKLSITFDIRFTGRIRNEKSIINSMFNDITHGGDWKVTFTEVYNVYAQPRVRNIGREIMSQYTVEDVHKNYSRISEEVQVALMEVFVGTPIELSNVSLGQISYPQIVTDAVAKAKQRNMEIEEVQAQAKKDLLKRENELAMAQANREIELTKAQTIADANKIMGESVTPELLKLKQIEVNLVMAEKSGNGTVYMPIEALTTSGASVRMLSK